MMAIKEGSKSLPDDEKEGNAYIYPRMRMFIFPLCLPGISSFLVMCQKDTHTSTPKTLPKESTTRREQ